MDESEENVGYVFKRPIPGSEESKQLEQQDMISWFTPTGHELIIKSFGSGGICAYYKLNGETRWEVKGRFPPMDKWMTARGIDTDGLGHLLVCDTANECIQMFNCDGDYLGVLLGSEDERQLGTPLEIRWNHQLSAAVVLYYKNLQCFLPLPNNHEMNQYKSSR